MTVLALALEVRREVDQAKAALREALDRGACEGYVRVFLDEGVRMVALLEDFERTSAFDDSVSAAQYAGAILRMVAVGAPASDAGRALADPLGVRELEVLRLMADGASNADIARRLVIGSATVKTHVNRIFRKLEAGSRTQAIARARALGLLQQ